MESAKPDAAAEVEWIKQAQRGDGEAFGRLVERYQRRVFSLVYHVVQRRDAVEDLAQEIFLKAYMGIQSFNFESSFGTWLGRVAVNHCYDHLRRERASRVRYFAGMSEEASQKLEQTFEGKQADAPDAEQRTLLRETVSALLERAPAEDRIILVLKEMEELSVEEIAEIMRLTKTAVKVRLHRARKRMVEDYHLWRGGR
jgi:RNA polymerase sigma-70 factor (ECF subfamily)